MGFSGDGNTVAAVSSGDASGGNLIVWDVPSKKPVLTLKPKGGTPRLGLSRDGKLLAASGSGGELSRETVIFEVPSGKVRSSVTVLHNFVFSADGKTLVEHQPIDGGMQLTVYDVSGPGKMVRAIKTPGYRADTAVLIDEGRHIALGGGLGVDEVRIYNLVSGDLVKTLPASRLKGPGRSLCIVRATPDSAFLVGFGTDKDIRLWTTPFGKKDMP